jgi:DNA repair ATPase RecN
MYRDIGLLFEVQMHTAASWTAKQESHREYEVLGSRTATAEERSNARIRQERIFARVPMPDGAAEITTYRKEGW